MEARKPRCPKGQWGFFMSAVCGRWQWTTQCVERRNLLTLSINDITHNALGILLGRFFLPTEKENRMQILCDSPLIQEALATQTELTRLITGYVERLSDYEGYELGQLVQFVVMASSDTVIELEAALGFSVRINCFTGCRYGNADFLPSWEVIEAHRYWYEVVYVLGDDGFGIVIFVPKDADAELIEMLQHYTPE